MNEHSEPDPIAPDDAVENPDENEADANKAPTEENPLEAAERERDEYLDKLQRLKAEYDNFRRRQDRERARWAREAIEGLVLDLLPVVDNFARAADADQGPEGHAEYVAGIQLVEKQLETVLAKAGVEPVEAEGQPFDPEVHEALQVIETADVEPNHVVSEFQRGYTMRGEIVRAAQVIVARAPQAAAPEDATDEAGE